MKKLSVEILGATGLVGQRLVLRLADHPWFQITRLSASKRWSGKKYAEAVSGRWMQRQPVPEAVAAMPLHACEPHQSVEVAFSALGSETARRVEPFYRRAGIIFCSNASSFRMAADVPLIIPEINANRLRDFVYNKKSGRYITNTNCAVSGIAMALAPVINRFGIAIATATTLQSISGAGIAGLPAMEIQDNLLPDISGEAEKIEMELNKVLETDFAVSVQTWRVPIKYGHSFSLDIRTDNPVNKASFRECLAEFNETAEKLPSSPVEPLVYCDGGGEPQPARLPLHDSMSVLTGGYRQVSPRRFQLRGCVDNLERGAAGAAVLNAEMACLLHSLP